MAFIEAGLYDMIIRLRGRGISDINVLRAMERVPRSAFVPLSHAHEAYDEKDLPIACGQTLPAPLTLAILCQTLDVHPDHKVLLIGTGTGYTSAVLANMCKRVYAIERYQTLAMEAEPRLQKHGANVVSKYGDGRYGWKGQAPFDRILIAAAVKKIPKSLRDQLKPDGKLVTVFKDMMVVFENGEEKEVLPLKISGLESGKSQAL